MRNYWNVHVDIYDSMAEFLNVSKQLVKTLSDENFYSYLGNTKFYILKKIIFIFLKQYMTKVLIYRYWITNFSSKCLNV